MDRPFLDKAKPPTTASLRSALGASYRAYEALAKLAAPFASEWNHAKTSGWMQKVHDGKKALFYVIPLEGSFTVSLTVREAERGALLEDEALASLHAPLREAKKYAEGYALRFNVTGARTLAPLERLLERILGLRATPRIVRG